MTGQIMLDGPKAPQQSPMGFCTVCAMSFKGRGTSDLKEEIEDAQADHGETTWFTLPPQPDPQLRLTPAIAWGFFGPWTPAPWGVGGNGLCPFPIPLCWSHLMGANVVSSFIQPAAAGSVPEPPRGAVDLAERQAALRRAGRSG